MGELVAMFVRYFVFNKSLNKRITYTKELGEKIQDLGSAVVNIPPVIGRHAGWTILWRPVVQEVGQQLCCPSCAAETLVEGSSKQCIRQQILISKARGWCLIIVIQVTSERFKINAAWMQCNLNEGYRVLDHNVPFILQEKACKVSLLLKSIFTAELIRSFMTLLTSCYS